MPYNGLVFFSETVIIFSTFSSSPGLGTGPAQPKDPTVGSLAQAQPRLGGGGHRPVPPPPGYAYKRTWLIMYPALSVKISTK